MELDVGDSKSVQNLLDVVMKQYKAPATIVVNSAGITRDNWMLKMSEADFDSVININLKVCFYTIEYVKVKHFSSINLQCPINNIYFPGYISSHASVR